MALLVVSFFAGVLTVLAPCILPLLPIVIGRASGTQNKYRPIVISASLAVAIVVFTLLLKASTAFINIPPEVWSYVSGTIIILFGLVSLFPTLWEHISVRLKFSQGSNTLLANSAKRKDTIGDIFIGLSLGPVFSSCSPTYFLILATVLPQSYLKGTIYLISYALGLASILLLIGYLGQRITSKLTGLSDPKGMFKRGLGVLFVLVGIFIMTGADKKVQSYILEHSSFNITTIEQKLLLDPMGEDGLSLEEASHSYPMYKEIVQPSGFVNTDPISLQELVGKKVILLDFMTYSCINCQRTFPYLNAWYDTYKDDGLEIIGIHTPEFAFEKKRENVIEAAKEFGLMFPIVLDNDYATWGAYKNKYWPRKYLIDINGNIVYDHIGEGAYEETEAKIQELLQERKRVLGEESDISFDNTSTIDAEHVDFSEIESRETYFGSLRNSNQGIVDTKTPDGSTVYSRPDTITPNQLYLVGTWNITGEYAEQVSTQGSIIFQYHAKKVFLVMESDKQVKATVLQDGKPVANIVAGEHVSNGTVSIQNEQLYRLIENQESGSHTLELRFNTPGVKVYAFTFG